MERLIDANKLKADFIGKRYGTQAIEYVIDQQQTVDAVEVVYCKGCVYSYPFDEEDMKYPYRVGEWHCEFWYAEMHGDDYCSCGKRRKDETDSQE